MTAVNDILVSLCRFLGRELDSGRHRLSVIGWGYTSMRIVERKVLFEGWTKFLAVTLQQPDGRSTERAVLDHGASVCVLPYDPERRLALIVCQTRIPLVYLGCREQLMEAIAGRVEDEQPPEAVRREAMEEAGLRIRDLGFVATCWSSPTATWTWRWCSPFWSGSCW